MSHAPSGAIFAEGERVLLVDRKERRYLVRLKAGGTFSTHVGIVAHDEIIGRREGSWVGPRRRDGTHANAPLLVLRPALSDIVLKMPRGAQVVYPKDLGAIIVAADIFPGARVLEAGVGSGALSMALLRAGASVTGYEVRDDFAARARANVHETLGDADYEVELRDIYEGIAARDLDRIVLDLPEPWRVLAHARGHLLPGGFVCAYQTSITQVATMREALRSSGFACAETFETLRRTWHVEGRAVRPDHRMVAHTGFLTTARLVETVDAEEGADAAALPSPPR